jgi:hypothetical protein
MCLSNCPLGNEYLSRAPYQTAALIYIFDELMPVTRSFLKVDCTAQETGLIF